VRIVEDEPSRVAECRVLSFVVLNVVILSVLVLNVIITCSLVKVLMLERFRDIFIKSSDCPRLEKVPTTESGSDQNKIKKK
jgi:hypothetical protein